MSDSIKALKLQIEDAKTRRDQLEVERLEALLKEKLKTESTTAAIVSAVASM